MAVTVTSFQMTSSSPIRTKSSSIRMSDIVADPMTLEALSDIVADSISLEAQVASKSRPIQDPMGLYSVNSEERKKGQINFMETDISSTSNTIYDPLNLYATESNERKSGQIKPLEPEVLVSKAVVDPLGLYDSGASIDDDAIMSKALPFVTRPLMLTGELPGDAGFDPLGFADSQADLTNYREAEIKHARLAMLAAAGWPLSEVLDKKIALALHMTPLIDAADRAPSILNGGLGKVNPFYWMACLGGAAAIEFYGTIKSKSGDESYFPGNLGFDPLGFYPKEEEGQRRMQLAEIKNGRLAMIAILGFAIQEFVSKSGVVHETPFFFFPLGADGFLH